MNVVMIGPFGMHPRGTMSVRALPMAKALTARGHRVSILLPPWQSPEDAGRRWQDDGVSVENVRLPRAVPGLLHPLTTLRLTRRAIELCPDVIHLFKPKAYSGLAHWRLARLPPTYSGRIVVDADDWEGPGGWNDLADYTPLEKRFFAWQERWGLTHADAITVASRTLESLVWALGVPQDRVFYVPNGKTGIADPEPRSRSEGDWILLYTRFFEFSLQRALDVFLRVRQSVPAARLLVVGKGLFGEEQRFLQLAADVGLEVGELQSSWWQEPQTRAADPNDSGVGLDVAYAGWVPAETLPHVFAGTRLAIYPFDDTLVNRAKCAVKLIDLLSAGLPVVAEDVGQNREYIRNGDTGLLVEPGDTGAFAEAIVRLWGDASLRSRLGQEASQDVSARFGWEKLVDTVERAYGMAA